MLQEDTGRVNEEAIKYVSNTLYGGGTDTVGQIIYQCITTHLLTLLDQRHYCDFFPINDYLPRGPKEGSSRNRRRRRIIQTP